VGSPREVVDLTFDVFDREGGAALASWMMLSGNEDALDPIVSTIDELVDELHPQESGHGGGQRVMHETTLALVLMALGDALIGQRLAESLGVARGTGRDRAEKMMHDSLVQVGDISG
jgi:hypothetical protein